LPDFAPVPRKYRHDGWTPERQKAFIEALADTGSVSRAAAMVNIAQTNAYALRRAPGAEGFRRAWDAALDFGLKRLKDIAFERATEGYLVPVFVAGKLMGFRRKHNDALLMFCLRHYGQDANGKRTTVNYFSSRASAGAGAVLRDGASAGSAPPQDERVVAEAEASATTVRTVISGRVGGGGEGGAQADDEAAAVLENFQGVALDARAAADIAAALEACAARAREAQAAFEEDGEAAISAGVDNPQTPFVRAWEQNNPHRGTLEPALAGEAVEPFVAGEDDWRRAGAEMPAELAYWRDAATRTEAERLAEAQGDGACTQSPRAADHRCKGIGQKPR
jgi:molybdenum-dependent DNA-binding transcriptional regulator ModE